MRQARPSKICSRPAGIWPREAQTARLIANHRAAAIGFANAVPDGAGCRCAGRWLPRAVWVAFVAKFAPDLDRAKTVSPASSTLGGAVFLFPLQYLPAVHATPRYRRSPEAPRRAGSPCGTHEDVRLDERPCGGGERSLKMVLKKPWKV